MVSFVFLVSDRSSDDPQPGGQSNSQRHAGINQGESRPLSEGLRTQQVEKSKPVVVLIFVFPRKCGFQQLRGFVELESAAVGDEEKSSCYLRMARIRVSLLDGVLRDRLGWRLYLHHPAPKGDYLANVVRPPNEW